MVTGLDVTGTLHGTGLALTVQAYGGAVTTDTFALADDTTHALGVSTDGAGTTVLDPSGAIYVGGRVVIAEMGSEIVRYRSGNVRVVPITYCPVEVYPSNDWTDLCRAEYSAWHAALVRLTERLETANLRAWNVTAPGAEARPWVRS